jgi:predicted DCC family thiol-disulfide oxidoreductase YuxK
VTEGAAPDAGAGGDVVDVVIFDGLCGLCDRFVSFVLARDARAQFRFAPQQGAWARGFLADHGVGHLAASTVFVVTGDGRLLRRSRAVFHVLGRLGGIWKLLAGLRLLPARVTDWGYDQIARRRMRLFGQLDACRLPTPAERARFISDD